MDMDEFHYKLQYITFPIDPINLKLTECAHGVVVNVYTKFEVIWKKKKCMSNLGYSDNSDNL